MPLATRPDPRATPWRARVIAFGTAAAGVTAILAALGANARGIVGLNELLNPAEYHAGTRIASVAIGIGLLYLAGNLARGKRVAWMLAMVLFGVNAVVSLTHILLSREIVNLENWLALALPVAMLALLGSAAEDFPAQPDPPTMWQVARFVPSYFAAVLLYGIAALYLERDDLTRPYTVAAAAETTVAEMIGAGAPLGSTREGFALYFPRSMVVLAVIGLGVALFLMLRTVVAQPRTASEWARAERLVHAYGTDTLSYFALRNDKSYFFSSDGEAMVAYCYLGGYALASGDPIGRPESIDLVIDEFLEMCRRHGWGQAFLAVREHEAPRYEARGLRSFYLGDEAIIHTDEFSLEGKKNKSMRQSVGRVARTFTFEMLAESDASDDLVRRLNDVSAKWRGKAPERGFTMALSQDVRGHNPEFRLCVATDEHGGIGGFLRIVPVFGDTPGYTLDMMRRDPDSPNGMTEFLIANTVFALRDEGVALLSMNFAVMGRLFSDDIEFTLGQRIMRGVVSLFNPFFQIKSLQEFNRRFRPRWQGRVCMYDDHRSLPHLALLYGGVEGFMALPVVGRWFVPTTHEPVPAASGPSAAPAAPPPAPGRPTR